MDRTRQREKRNFGWGKNPVYAARQALRRFYGYGHFETQEAHVRAFKALVKQLGVNDARLISDGLVMDYAEHLLDRMELGEIVVDTAQCRLSGINQVFRAFGCPPPVPSPREVVGSRTRVRTTIPRAGYTDDGSPHAMVAGLQFGLGVREREAGLQEIPRLVREAERHGRVNIVDGTKGGRGRECPRWVPVPPEVFGILEDALRCLREKEENMVDRFGRYVKWRNSYDHWWRVNGAGRAHDLRALFACRRYAELTGHSAPVLAGCRVAPRDTDREARKMQAGEMGHGRADVMASYYGSPEPSCKEAGVDAPSG